jgi:hypothetical protein
LVAETLGATSDRKNQKVSREPVLFKVIRSDDDVATTDAAPAPAVPMVADESPATGGKLSLWIRRTLGRLRKKS